MEELLPSTNHSFEPEFTGHPPRPIPDRLDEGPYARGRRRTAILLAASGAICLLLARAPGVDVLARYVLPFGYLSWIGVGLLALAAAGYVPLALRAGPFRYVRDGLPLAVRVLDLVKTPTAIVNGSPTTHGFVARVLFRHPDSGETVSTDLKSNDFSSHRKDAYDTPFKVGDTVTAAYLPGRLEKTLRLYAFLELSPDLHLRARSAPSADSPWTQALLLAAIPAIFVVLFANVYAYGRYHPVEFEYRRAAAPLAAGAILLGGGLLAGLYLAHRSEQERLRRRAEQAAAEGRAVELATPFLGRGAYGWAIRIAVALGAPLLGGLTALCWCFMANAWLDRSQAAPVPATIVGRTMTTHAFLFREYELEYRLAGSDATLKLLTTPEHLIGLRGPEAIAYVRRGRLGWPWVETVASP
ncbi:MAG TPA: hypothetical protein VFM88_19875 [Vicinamibacteria bacterium]|nr:hypothetical protein [Vicinamibacteria bacterium]